MKFLEGFRLFYVDLGDEHLNLIMERKATKQNK